MDWKSEISSTFFKTPGFCPVSTVGPPGLLRRKIWRKHVKTAKNGEKRPVRKMKNGPNRNSVELEIRTRGWKCPILSSKRRVFAPCERSALQACYAEKRGFTPNSVTPVTPLTPIFKILEALMPADLVSKPHLERIKSSRDMTFLVILPHYAAYRIPHIFRNLLSIRHLHKSHTQLLPKTADPKLFPF